MHNTPPGSAPLNTNNPARLATSGVLAELGDHGLTTITLPPSAGGAGVGSAPQSTPELLDILRTVGRRNLAAGRLFEGHVNALWLIERYAAAAARDKWFAACRAGAWFGVWNTNDASPVRSDDVGSHRLLQGGKRFCSGAGFLDHALITVQNPDGSRRMLIVPMADISLERIDATGWQPLGMLASDSFAVDFTGVRADATQFLGADDAYIEEPFFSAGAIRFAAVQLGGAEALAMETAAFLQGRNRAEESFQEARFAELEIDLQAARALLRQAAQLFDEAQAGQPVATAEVLHAAFVARMAVDRAATNALHTTDRAVGANGYLAPLPFAELHKDLTMYLRQPVPDQVTARIGRHVLTQNVYAASFSRDEASLAAFATRRTGTVGAISQAS